MNDSSVLDWSNDANYKSIFSSCEMAELPPVSNIDSEQGAIAFQIYRSPWCINLSSMFLQMKLRVVKNDGSPLSEFELVAPCNLLPYAMFGSVELAVNGTKITSPINNNMYPYLVHFLTFGFMEQDMRTRMMKGAFLYDDEPGASDELL